MFLEALVRQRETLTGNTEPFFYVAEVERVKANCLASIREKKREFVDRLNEL